MTIQGINEVQLTQVLTTHLSPSKEINDPRRLIGREKYLTRIRRSLQSPGRHVFIYGERGIGKTSLACTAGLLATHEAKNFIYIPCGEKSTFFEVMAAIGNSMIDVDKRVGVAGLLREGAHDLAVVRPVGRQRDRVQTPFLLGRGDQVAHRDVDTAGGRRGCPLRASGKRRSCPLGESVIHADRHQ